MIRAAFRIVNLIAACMMDGTNLRDYGCLLLTTAEAKGLKLTAVKMQDRRIRNNVQ